jgi:hypothetical protein
MTQTIKERIRNPMKIATESMMTATKNTIHIKMARNKDCHAVKLIIEIKSHRMFYHGIPVNIHIKERQIDDIPHICFFFLESVLLMPQAMRKRRQ